MKEESQGKAVGQAPSTHPFDLAIVTNIRELGKDSLKWPLSFGGRLKEVVRHPPLWANY